MVKIIRAVVAAAGLALSMYAAGTAHADCHSDTCTSRYLRALELDGFDMSPSNDWLKVGYGVCADRANRVTGLDEGSKVAVANDWTLNQTLQLVGTAWGILCQPRSW